jgi:AAHS family 4-hydroxybenzoate transporter-like MFS transporter
LAHAASTNATARLATATVDVDELLDRQSWRTTGWVLLWAAAAMLVDGYDLLAISNVAPDIIKDWGLTKATFAPAFSAANLAAMLGGVAVGYFADWAGRKKALVFATLLLGVSTLGTAFATDLTQLLVWRFVAGLGLGAVPPIAIVMVNEYAPARMRATIVAGVYLGNALGVLFAGVIYALLVPTHGWQAVFVIGGVAPLAVCVGLAFCMPESLRFLVTQRPDSPRIARILAWLAPSATFAPGTRFIIGSETAARGVPLALLFADGRWALTLLFWLAYFASGITLYTMTSWSPVILGTLGVGSAHAALIASLSGLAGWSGGMVITRFMDRYGLGAMAVPPLLGVPLLAALGYLGGTPELTIMIVSLLGAMAYSGGHTGLHATGGLIYPTAIRANGVALGLFMTRAAGVIAPIVAGALFTSDGARQVLWLTALPLLVVSACFVALGRLRRRRETL